MAASSLRDHGTPQGRVVLWTAIDPLGRQVCLTDDVWNRKAANRPELRDYFTEIRETVERPNAGIFEDAISTRQKNPGVAVETFFSQGRCRGDFAHCYLQVSVKFVPEEDAPNGKRGYVQTAILASDVQKRFVRRIWPL
jgi:hypothetical protein